MSNRLGIASILLALTMATSLGLAEPAGARSPATSVPGAPQSVVLSPMDSALGVSWTAPKHDGGLPITKYVAMATRQGSTTGPKCTTTGATTCVITGLTNGTRYSVTVRAHNAVGFGKPSDVVKGKPEGGGSIGFNDPYDIAFDGTNIWVTNEGNNSVVEFTRSGVLVRSLSGASYGFDGPSDLTVDGTHLWVTNSLGNSVTEINSSDGSLVRTISGGSYGFAFPAGIASDGSHLWVANTEGNSVTEVNASDGSWVRTVSGGSYGFDVPSGVTVDGSDDWGAN